MICDKNIQVNMYLIGFKFHKRISIRAYTTYHTCVGEIIPKCGKLVKAVFGGVNEVYGFICGPGKEGKVSLYITYQDHYFFHPLNLFGPVDVQMIILKKDH